MGIKEFLQDEGSVRLGQLLGGVLSLKAGRELARFVADIMTRRGESGMVQNIMANQWVVSGGTLSGADLEKQAGKVMRHITRSLFDYFYFTQHLKEARGLLEISPRMQEALRESIEGKKPTILLGPHLGSFDLFGLMLTRLGLRPYVLSFPTPNNAYRAQNKLREKSGMLIRPIDFGTYREAKKLLKEGACLVTGMDRPIEEDGEVKYKPLFFGRPASLPVFYVRLAVDTNATVRVACGMTMPDNRLFMDCSEPIPFERHGDPAQEYELNAGMVAAAAEKFILQNPDQWAMFYPVWPEALSELHLDH